MAQPPDTPDPSVWISKLTTTVVAELVIAEISRSIGIQLESLMPIVMA